MRTFNQNSFFDLKGVVLRFDQKLINFTPAKRRVFDCLFENL